MPTDPGVPPRWFPSSYPVTFGRFTICLGVRSMPKGVSDIRLATLGAWCLFLATAGGAIVWLWLDHSPPMWDQSWLLRTSIDYYRLWTERPLWEALKEVVVGYHYRPPLVPLIASVLYLPGGLDPDVAQLAVLPFVGLLIWAVFGLGRTLWRPEVGVLAGFMVITAPMMIEQTREFMLDVPVTALVVTALYLLVRDPRFESPGDAYRLGAVCGLGMLTKWSFAFFTIGPLAVGLVRLAGETWPGWRQRAAVAVAIGLGAAAAIGLYAAMAAPVRALAKQSVLAGVAVTVIVTLPPIARWLGRAAPRLSGLAAPASLVARWLNATRLAAVALLIGGPWYLANAYYLRRDFARFGVQAAGLEGDPDPLTLPSLMYGVWSLFNVQLFLVSGLIAVSGLLAWRRVRPERGARAPLLGCFAIGYAITTLIPNKDPRFTLPLVPLLLLVGAAWIWSLRPKWRRLLCAAVAAVGVVQYAALGFDYGPLDRTVSLPLPASRLTEFGGLGHRPFGVSTGEYRRPRPQLVVYSTAGRRFEDLGSVSSRRPMPERPPLERILQAVPYDVDGRRPVVVFRVNERSLNSATMNYLASLYRHPLTAWKWRDEQHAEAAAWAGTRFVLARPGDPGVTAHLAVLERSFCRVMLTRLGAWRFAEGLEVELLQIEAGVPNPNGCSPS